MTKIRIVLNEKKPVTTEKTNFFNVTDKRTCYINREPNSGGHYIEIDSLLDYTESLSKDLEGLIEVVTMKEMTSKGHFFEGVYRCEGAEMEIKNIGVGEGNLYEIKIKAPSVEILQKFYNLLRQGKLIPDERWGKESVSGDDSKIDDPPVIDLIMDWLKNLFSKSK
jgi:hypothetical protein